MSTGCSVSWTETCDAVTASQAPPIDTTVQLQQQQQQQQPRSLSQTFTEIMHDARSSELNNCTESIAAIEASRTPKNTRIETLAESLTHKRRKRQGKPNWRQVIKGEDKRFEKAFHEAITNLIQNDPDFKRWKQERQYEQICKSICSYTNENNDNEEENNDDDTFIKTLITIMKPIIRKLLFHPLDILRSMDLSGGILSYEAIKILRGVETGGVKFLRSIIPSTTEIQKAANLVERIADKECPLKHEVLDLGEKKVESISLDLPKIAKLLIEAFGLEDVAKQRGVEFVQTMDGAKLSKNENHTSMGIRLIDIETKDPVTGKYLFQEGGLGLIQSRDCCIPVQTIFSNETKEIMSLFDPQFQTTKELGLTNTNSVLKDAGYKPLKFTAAGDMSNCWKALKAGGGVGVAGVGFPCECCPLRATNWCRPNSNCVRQECKLCQQIYRDRLLSSGAVNPYYSDSDVPPLCYHHTMLTEDNRETRTSELEAYIDKLGNYAEIKNATKLNYNDDPLYATSNKQ